MDVQNVLKPKRLQLLLPICEGKALFALMTASLSLYLMIIFYSIPLVVSASAGTRIFDVLPTGYTQADALQILTSIGEAGRSTYLYLQLPLDAIYPALFAISHSCLFIWLARKRYALSSNWLYVAYLPFMAATFDYAENIGIWTMLTQYPNVMQNTVDLACLFTQIKSLVTTVFFTACLIVLVQVLISRMKVGRLNKR